MLATLMFAGVVTAPASSAPDCTRLLPGQPAKPSIARALTAKDLVRLRDIGEPTDRIDLPSPFSLSPDGSMAAFLLRQADPQTNSYCQGLVLVSLDKSAPPVLLDTGGDIIRTRYPRNGLDAPETGLPAVVTPAWSPDGRFLAYRRRENGTIAIRIVERGTRRARTLDSGSHDVQTFDWTDDGADIIFETLPGRREAQEAIEKEGRRGFLFDDRFRPMASNAPFPAAGFDSNYRVINIISGSTREPEVEETAPLIGEAPAHAPQASILFAVNGPARAWTERRRSPSWDFSDRLLAMDASGTHFCVHPDCRDQIIGLWPDRRRRAFVYLRREGFAQSLLSLYRWRPGRAPEKLYQTENLLIGCQPASAGLYCLEEGGVRPRRLVRFDPRTWRPQPVFEPNPEFAGMKIGSRRRLYWTNDFGQQAFGDLVLPQGHVAGQRHPLIVVHYTSRGFLRGGTGDEYPVQPFANRGFAVLNLDYPRTSPRDAQLLAGKSLTQQDQEDWSWRRRAQSSLEHGLQAAIATGTIDRQRMGVTGLSDGASSAIWALIHSPMFAAASISSCCIDSGSLEVAGPALVKAFEKDGYPSPIDAAADFWRESSLAANADRISVPILLQLSDDEYLNGLKSWYQYRARRRPFEMYVFPGERHIKWQPVHRLAIYERNLDWFDFWLNGRENPEHTDPGQYERWRKLKGH